MGNRRKARVAAMQAIYMHETVNKTGDELLSFSWLEDDLDKSSKDFATTLISGTLDKLSELDDIIRSYSKNWKFERISSIDKAVLRISIYELKFISSIPYAITINEAIEISKKYGGENSGQFINGILDNFRKSLDKNDKSEK